MADQDLDDDSVNALNAEVRKQREEAVSDDHLLTQNSPGETSAEMLRHAAWAMRVHEALKAAGR